MYPLRHNTASQEVPLGYFLDTTDADTAETGVSLANTDILLHKAGATSLAAKNSGGSTHLGSGIVYVTLDATDSNTPGPMVLFQDLCQLKKRLWCMKRAYTMHCSHLVLQVPQPSPQLDLKWILIPHNCLT
jgi:hypothetical protein